MAGGRGPSAVRLRVDRIRRRRGGQRFRPVCSIGRAWRMTWMASAQSVAADGPRDCMRGQALAPAQTRRARTERQAAALRRTAGFSAAGFCAADASAKARLAAANPDFARCPAAVSDSPALSSAEATFRSTRRTIPLCRLLRLLHADLRLACGTAHRESGVVRSEFKHRLCLARDTFDCGLGDPAGGVPCGGFPSRRLASRCHDDACST